MDLLEEILKTNHIQNCTANEEQKIELPKKGVNDVLKLKDFKKKIRCPFIPYCDFKILNKEIMMCMQNPDKSSSTITKLMESKMFATIRNRSNQNPNPALKTKVGSFGYKHVSTEPRYT